MSKKTQIRQPLLPYPGIPNEKSALISGGNAAVIKVAKVSKTISIILSTCATKSPQKKNPKENTSQKKTQETKPKFEKKKHQSSKMKNVAKIRGITTVSSFFRQWMGASHHFTKKNMIQTTYKHMFPFRGTCKQKPSLADKICFENRSEGVWCTWFYFGMLKKSEEKEGLCFMFQEAGQEEAGFNCFKPFWNLQLIWIGSSSYVFRMKVVPDTILGLQKSFPWRQLLVLPITVIKQNVPWADFFAPGHSLNFCLSPAKELVCDKHPLNKTE